MLIASCFVGPVHFYFTKPFNQHERGHQETQSHPELSLPLNSPQIGIEPKIHRSPKRTVLVNQKECNLGNLSVFVSGLKNRATFPGFSSLQLGVCLRESLDMNARSERHQAGGHRQPWGAFHMMFLFLCHSISHSLPIAPIASF